MSININLDAKETFRQVVKDFFSVRSFITIGAFGTAYFMSWQGKQITDIIIRIIDLLLGFWFGEKVAKAIIQNGNGGQR